MSIPSAYEISQIVNVSVKVIATFISVLLILPLQIRELSITKDDGKYFSTASTLMVLNGSAIILTLLSFVAVYVRTHYNIDDVTYYTYANYLSLVYLIYSIGWFVLYRKYFIKKKNESN